MTQTPEASDLVALVGSRIAHDLASPIGAIANGVELLGLAGYGDGPELALITESVEAARARIKVFRIAFGAATPGQSVPADDIAALATATGRKLEIDWPVTGDVARPEAKLIALALMCLEVALPWGGQIRVRPHATGWRLEAEAARLAIEPGLWDRLGGEPADPEPVAASRVQFLLLPAEAAAQGRSLDVTRGDTHISIAL